MYHLYILPIPAGESPLEITKTELLGEDEILTSDKLMRCKFLTSSESFKICFRTRDSGTLSPSSILPILNEKGKKLERRRKITAERKISDPENLSEEILCFPIPKIDKRKK